MLCSILYSVVAIPCAKTLQLTIDLCLISPISKTDFLEFHIQQHRANQIRYWNTFRLFAQAWKEQHSCEEISIQTKDCVWKGNPCCTVLRIFSDKVKIFQLRKEAESAVALNELLRKLLSQIYRAGIVQMPPESKLLIQSEAGIWDDLIFVT